MISVKFLDNSREQAAKIEKRKELLDIINDHPEWMEDDELVDKVQKLAFWLSNPTMDGSKPIEYIDPESFTVKEYKFLKFLGYSEMAIYRAMNVTKRAFEIYKTDRLRLSKEDRKNVRKNKWNSPA